MSKNLVFKAFVPTEINRESAADNLRVMYKAYWKGQPAYTICSDPDKHDYHVYGVSSFMPNGGFVSAGDLQSVEEAQKKIEDLVADFEKWLQAKWFAKKLIEETKP